jgi:ribosomal protein S18 acetylase RimI-like enzyme
MGTVTSSAVKPDEIEEFLDWFERYWEELETFSDFPDPFSRTEYRRLLREPGDHHFWWADVEGRHAGFCVFTIGHHWYRRDLIDGYVDEFYIDPAFRRGGVGRTLAQSMFSEFHRRKVRRIELSVLPRNARARAFWTSLGFELALLRMAWAGDVNGPPATIEK